MAKKIFKDFCFGQLQWNIDKSHLYKKVDDDGNIIDTDKDNENPPTTIYIHGLGLIAQENEEGGYLTYHYDHLGSTTAITDETGKVIHTYTYGPYGELLSGDAKNIRFLYNGMYGVSTDSNGLYYMRARYYNVDIKRFISQDILTGSISNSQSLNRYSYVQGNPISLTDPFGLSPDISWSGVGHAVLDLLGCVPVVGFAFDLVNAGWYLAEGDNFGFVTSLISAVPGAGSFVGNKIKYGVKASKKLMLAGDLIINSTKMIGHGATFVRGTYGVVVSGGRIVTDIKDGKTVNPWDVLQLGLSGTAVGISGKGMVTSAGATIDNVNGLNELRVSKSAVGGSDQLIKMDLQFFASDASRDISGKNNKVTNKTLSTSSKDLKVIGRLEDTEVAKNWKGHDVLNDPSWTLQKNDAWVNAGIKNKQDFYIASPMNERNLISTNPKYPGPTVFAREIDMLQKSNYVQKGDYFIHPE